MNIFNYFIKKIKYLKSIRLYRVIFLSIIFFIILEFTETFFLKAMISLTGQRFTGIIYAAPDDFSRYLQNAKLGNYIQEYPCRFFAPVHSPPSPNGGGATPSLNTLSAAIMPLIYLFNEKYPLCPPESKIKNDVGDKFSKYIPKIDNLAGNIRLKILLDHAGSPVSLCELDFFANLTFAWLQNFYLASAIKHDKIPVAATTLCAGPDIKNRIIYYYIDTTDYSVYLTYTPSISNLNYDDLISETLAFNKKNMQFFIVKSSESAAHYTAEPAIILLHDLKDIASKFDRFAKLNGSVRIGFDYLFDFLKLQIEKKIIKDDERLKSYRAFHFLSPERQKKLSGLIKKIKNDILQPELATYSKRFTAVKPLQVEMGEKNKDEQQRAILKKFSFLNEKIGKMNIELKPKREYDFIFKKLNIGGK